MALLIPYNVIAGIAVGFAEAEEKAGARETGGNDAGPWVTKYLNANHSGRQTHRNEPWCAAFFCWCWVEAAQSTGKNLVVKYTRGVDELWRRMETFGRVQKLVGGVLRPELQQQLPPSAYLCQPGDACFWDWNGDDNPDHVNMVHHVDADGFLYTIGGNEGPSSSGSPVLTKRRGRLGELPRLHGFGRMFREEVL